MAQLTLEGFVEHGQIRLKEEVHLPEKTKVYVDRSRRRGSSRILSKPTPSPF
jgi:hypothetical protein